MLARVDLVSQSRVELMIAMVSHFTATDHVNRCAAHLNPLRLLGEM
jgi:hypothetical protein